MSDGPTDIIAFSTHRKRCVTADVLLIGVTARAPLLPHGLHTLHGLYPLFIASCRLLNTRRFAALMLAAYLHHA